MSTLSTTARSVKPDAKNIREHLKAVHLERWVKRVQPHSTQVRVHMTEAAVRLNKVDDVVHSLRELWQDGWARVVKSIVGDAVVIYLRGWYKTVPGPCYVPPKPQGEHYLWDRVVEVLAAHPEMPEIDIETEDESVTLVHRVSGLRPASAYEWLIEHGLRAEVNAIDTVVLVLPNRFVGDAELEACVEYLERIAKPMGWTPENTDAHVRRLRDGWDDMPQIPVEDWKQEALRRQIVQAMRVHEAAFAPQRAQEPSAAPSRAEWRALWPEGHPDGREWPSDKDMAWDETYAEAFHHGYTRAMDRYRDWTLDELEVVEVEWREEEPSCVGDEGEVFALDKLMNKAFDRYEENLALMPSYLLTKMRIVHHSRLGMWQSLVDHLARHEAELTSQTEHMSVLLASDVRETAERYRTECARLGYRITLIDRALAAQREK